MVISYHDVFGYKKGEKPESETGLSANRFKKSDQGDGFERIAVDKGVNKMANEKKYKSLIQNLVEKGAVHAKGQILQVPIDDERAKNLINAGYIEEVVEVEAKTPEEEKKNLEAPENKMETGADKKDATGKGANLLKGKRKK